MTEVFAEEGRIPCHIEPYTVQHVKPHTVQLTEYAQRMDIKEIFSANLERRLKAFGGQRGFQRARGAAQSTVGALVRMERAADIETVAYIAEKLDCEAWELLLPETPSNKSSADKTLGVKVVDRISADPQEVQLLAWYRRLSLVNKRRVWMRAYELLLEDDPAAVSDPIGATGVSNEMKPTAKKRHVKRDATERAPAAKRRRKGS